MDSNNFKNQVGCSLSNTRYDVIRYICKTQLNWQVKDSTDDWDLLWTDSSITSEQLKKMKPFQKINHFPGMECISRKNYLAKNLNKLQKLFPDDYSFFPKTWIAPIDRFSLKLYINNNPDSFFIVKPEASCQGKGIFITRNVEDIDLNKKVVQAYILNPLLIDGLKFDLRIYVLLTGCNPLRVFVYQEGLARFATEPYSRPSVLNSKKSFMHLTNYAINKLNSRFIHNEDPEKDNIGHKRSISSVFNYLSESGVDTEKLWKEIESCIVKTLCCAQPYLWHEYNSSQAEDLSNSMCFEVLGFDILIDSQYKPFILEVNHTPSFRTESPLDLEIKRNLIKDTIELVNINYKARNKFYLKEKALIYQRSHYGVTEKLSKQEKYEKRKAMAKKRNGWEENHMGGFKKVFPLEDAEQYQRFIKAADDLWQQYTGFKRVKKIRTLPLKIRTEADINESMQPSMNFGKNSVFERLSRKPIKKNSSMLLPKIVYQHVSTKNQPSALMDNIFDFSEQVTQELIKKQEVLLNKKLLRAEPVPEKKRKFVKKQTLKELLRLSDLKLIIK